MTLSLIIPVYNEEGSVLETVRAAYHALSDALSSFEIIVVNDGSTDGTSMILQRISLPNLHIVHHVKNRGNGAAIQTGLAQAQGVIIATMDADGTYNPEDIPKLLTSMNRQRADMAVGVRQGMENAKWSHRTARNVLRKIAERECKTSIPDINSGLRLCKKDVMMRFQNLYPQRFSLHIALTIAALKSGVPVIFEPITYGTRIGTSKLSAGGNGIANFFKFLWLILRISEKIENSRENTEKEAVGA